MGSTGKPRPRSSLTATIVQDLRALLVLWIIAAIVGLLIGKGCSSDSTGAEGVRKGRSDEASGTESTG